MRRPHQRQCWLLLLMLTISQIGLAAHSVEHIDFGDEQVCQLNHARDEHDAILPSSDLAPVGEVFAAPTSGFEVSAPVTPSYSYYSARAPPLSL